MKILCAGGGPGGLYSALLIKKAFPQYDVTVRDRNPPDATYGWGVVFSDETLGFLEDADAPSYAAIVDRFVHWQDIDIHYRGERITSGGHAFSGLARVELLGLLQARCREVDARLEYGVEVEPDELDAYDLVIAADGLNSRIRERYAPAFQAEIDRHATKYIWLGAEIDLESFTFLFKETQFGLFQVHAYPFAPGMATFIVECNEPVWRAARLDVATENESIDFCSDLFADFLAGRRLLSNRSSWINFLTLRTANWRHRSIVLLGDAAHTAHFSIGSGTKLAMEDAIALAAALENNPNRMNEALVEYEELRRPAVERTQTAARESSLWFEHASRYAHFDPTQFAFSLLTRSKRVTYENLARRDPAFTGGVDRWYTRTQSTLDERPLRVYEVETPMRTPFVLRDVHLRNRVVRSLPARGPTLDGSVDGESAYEAVAEARTGAGLVLTDMVAVSPEGRISDQTTGLYDDGHVDAWQAIVGPVTRFSCAAVGVLLGHAGPRGATRPAIDGIDLPAREPWALLAASPMSYAPTSPVPKETDREDMDRVLSSFVIAAGRAVDAGFGLIEMDMAHGYLLGSFLSPLTNQRADEYGGSVEHRLRFPLEVFRAVRLALPQSVPLAVRLNGTDWASGGVTPKEVLHIVRTLRDEGCDLFDVVSGWTTTGANPPYGPAWQVPMSDAIRNECGVRTMTSGFISTADEVNTILAAGRADLCLVSRRAWLAP